jgi:ribosomal protein S25
MKEQEQKRRTRTQTKSELKRLTKKFSKLKNDDDIMKNSELNEEKIEKAKKEILYE